MKGLDKTLLVVLTGLAITPNVSANAAALGGMLRHNLINEPAKVQVVVVCEAKENPYLLDGVGCEYNNEVVDVQEYANLKGYKMNRVEYYRAGNTLVIEGIRN